MRAAAVFRFLLFSLFGLYLACPLTARADGVYKPSPAIPANPKIPSQRALIVFKDNVETLVVESAFDTPSDKVGWILPLPADPTHIAPADPGMLRSLAFSLRPYVATGSRGVAYLAPVLLLITCLLAWSAYSGHPAIARVTLLALLFSLVLICLILPSLGSGTAPAVPVPATQVVGHYTVSVLHPTDADGLNAWLAENKLARLATNERPVVDDYIKRNWCFAVAVLARDPATGRLASPHPLAATFPSKSPVYPMKLTALAGGDTHVDLFIAARDQCAADWFDVTAAATFTAAPAKDDRGPYLGSDVKHMTIGQPDAVALIPSGSVVTRLTADLPVKAMDHDITPAATDYVPCREYFATREVRRDRTIAVFVTACCVPIAWLGVVRRNRRPLLPPDRTLLRVFVAVCPFAALCTWLYTPVTDAHVIDAGDRPQSFLAVSQLSDAGVLIERGRLTAATTPEQLKALLPELTGGHPNPYTSQPVIIERSPGNLAVRNEGDTGYLCAYDIDGVEHRIKLPATRPSTTPAVP